MQFEPLFLNFISFGFFIVVCREDNSTRILLFDYQCNLIHQKLIDELATHFAIYSSIEQMNYLLLILNNNQLVVLDSFYIEEIRRFELDFLVQSILVFQTENLILLHTTKQNLYSFHLLQPSDS